MSGVPITGDRLRSIDLLRGVAVLAVLAIHIPHEAPGGWREHPFFFPAFLAEFGYLGVPLFIVISGFCIHRRAALARQATGSYAFDWLDFWKRRFIRLYPPYVAAIVFALACAFWLHDRFATPETFLGWDLALHLLLVHNLTEQYATSLGNGAFWSLGTEEQLYALYAVLLALLATRGRATAIAIVAIVTIAWRLAAPHFEGRTVDVGPFDLGQWFQWPFHYWLHWALGAIAVDAWLGNRALPRWCASAPLALGLLCVGLALNKSTLELLARTSFAPLSLLDAAPATLGTWHNFGELAVALACFIGMNRLLRSEADGRLTGRMSGALAFVGRISYSLYLVHVPVIYVLEEQLPFGYTPADWLARYTLYGMVTLGVAYAFHRGVERWFLSGRLPRLRWRAQPVAEGA